MIMKNNKKFSENKIEGSKKSFPKWLLISIIAVLSISLILVCTYYAYNYVHKSGFSINRLKNNSENQTEQKFKNEKEANRKIDPQVFIERYEFAKALLEDENTNVYVHDMYLYNEHFTGIQIPSDEYIIDLNGEAYKINLSNALEFLDSIDVDSIDEFKAYELNKEINFVFNRREADTSNYHLAGKSVMDYYTKIYNDFFVSAINYFTHLDLAENKGDYILFKNEEYEPFFRSDFTKNVTGINEDKFAVYQKKSNGSLYAFSIDKNYSVYLYQININDDGCTYSAKRRLNKWKPFDNFMKTVTCFWRKYYASDSSSYQSLDKNLKDEIKRIEEDPDSYDSYYLDFHSLSLDDFWWIYETDDFIFAGAGKDPSFINSDYVSSMIDIFIPTDDENKIYRSIIHDYYLARLAFYCSDSDDKSEKVTDLDIKLHLAFTLNEKLFFDGYQDCQFNPENFVFDKLSVDYCEFIRDLIYARHGAHVEGFDRKWSFEEAFGYIDEMKEVSDDDLCMYEKDMLKAIDSAIEKRNGSESSE